VYIICKVLRPEDQYHAGIVVADLDATLEKLTALAGYQFADEYKGDNLVRTPDGESLVSMRFAYSLGPAPLIEVIQQCPGTVWMPVPGSGLHHVGYWVDDVEAESAALEAAGLSLEVAGVGPDGNPYWAYYSDGIGPRLELVSRAAKPMIDAWTTTGKMPF